MGIRGLTEFVKKQGDVLRFVNLTQEAALRNGGSKEGESGGRLRIYCHYSGLLYHLAYGLFLSFPLQRLIQTLGGEYEAFALKLESYIQSLRDGGVELVFFKDKYLGLNSEEAGRKLKKLRERCKDIETRYKNWATFLSNREMTPLQGVPLEEMPGYSNFDPGRLATDVLVGVLKRMNCRVVICEGAAADQIMWHYREERPYAILSSDADFFVMDGVRTILFEHLNVAGRTVTAKVIEPSQIAASLQIPPDSLHTLAAICGNDITGSYLKKRPLFKEAFKLSGDATNRVRQVALLLKENWKNGKCEVLERKLTPRLRELFDRSDRFYRGTTELPSHAIDDKEDLMFAAVRERVRDMEMGSTIWFLMATNEYWLRGVYFEQGAQTVSSIDDTHLPLRRFWYGLLRCLTVTEYYYDVDTCQFEPRRVAPLEGLPANLLSCALLDRLEMLSMFSHVHFIPGSDMATSPLEMLTRWRKLGYLSPLNFLQEAAHQEGSFARSDVALVLLLRYLVSSTFRAGFAMDRNEYGATVAMIILLQLNPSFEELKRLMNLQRLPTCRVIHLSSWIISCYRCLTTTCDILSLGCPEGTRIVFPLPSKVFSGTLLVHFYQEAQGGIDLLNANNLATVLQRDTPAVAALLNTLTTEVFRDFPSLGAEWDLEASKFPLRHLEAVPAGDSVDLHDELSEPDRDNTDSASGSAAETEIARITQLVSHMSSSS